MSRMTYPAMDESSAHPFGNKEDERLRRSRNETQERGNHEEDRTGAKGRRFRNPFKLPRDADYAKILEEEEQRRKMKFKQTLYNPIHSKTPARQKPLSSLLQTISEPPEIQLEPHSPASEIRNDPSFRQAMAKDEALRNREDLTTFLQNKREIFLIQYMVGVKRDAMLRLIERENQKEKHLSNAEKCMEDDAIQFSDFLRFNDRKAVGAIKHAEMETRVKLDKASEIKKLNILIVNYKSKISKLEDILTEYKTYAKFLTSVAPLEWKQHHKVGGRQQRELEISGSKALPTIKESRRLPRAHSSIQLPAGYSKKSSPFRSKQRDKITTLSGPKSEQSSDIDLAASTSALAQMLLELQLSVESVQYFMEDDEDENVDLYFTEPDQLADIFRDLQEKNLSLIQKTQETEETLDEAVTTFENIKKRMKLETKLLRQQVAMMEQSLEAERKKGNNFELLSKYHSFGKASSEAQDNMLSAWCVKIDEVYTRVLGPNDANLNAIQMMTAIETKLSVLLDELEIAPMYKVTAATKTRLRQRRLMKRQEKERELAEYLHQRKLRTLKKASFVPSQTVTRTPISRSKPPPIKSERQMHHASRAQEELVYFFT